MSVQSFQERLGRIEGRDKRAAASAGAMNKPRNDRERLVIALGLLKRNGVRSNRIYPLAFRVLTTCGIVLRPLHYWSLLGLVALVFAGMSLILFALISTCDYFGVTPTPLALLIEAGPAVFLGFNFLGAAIYAAVLKAQALQMELPRWKDL